MHLGLLRALDDSRSSRFVMALSARQRPEPGKDLNLKRKGLTVSPRGGPVFSTTGLGSPHWTRFELSRPKTRSARTTPIAFRPMTSAQSRRTHPDWVPRRDGSRTTRKRAHSDRE